MSLMKDILAHVPYKSHIPCKGLNGDVLHKGTRVAQPRTVQGHPAADPGKIPVPVAQPAGAANN